MAQTKNTAKIAIIGAGSVGATIAYACLIRGVGKQIALFDVNRAKVDAEVLDLNHGLQFVPMATVEGSDDVGVCADADIVVITAGAKQKQGQTRMDLASANADICRKLVPQILHVAPDAVFLLVTNPVDVITYVTVKLTGLPHSRVLGSGTVLDSSRFRYLIAERCRVAVQNVHAYIAGEHGDTELPLWGSASIGSVPLLEWTGAGGSGPLTAEIRDGIAREVVESAYRIIEGKGATNYAVALAGSRIIEAILKDEGRVLPVSSLLDDFYGISDVCLSVPAIVGASGVGERLPVPLSDEELVGLRSSADAVRSVARQFGF